MSEQGNKMKESNDQMIIDALLEAREKNSGQLKQMEELAQQMGIVVPEKNTKSVGKVFESNIEIEEEKPQSTINYMDGYEYVPEEENSTREFDYYADVDGEDIDIPHDLVSLPSRGLIYGKGFKSKIAVAYLTAADEDMITNPALYQDNQIINLLLKKKILDKNIDPFQLCEDDRNAIILWLRISGYDKQFPVRVTDPATGEQFDGEADLSEIKIKPFILKPNSNGLFDFKLPKSEKNIEFRFLVHKDELDYNKMLQKTNEKLKKYSLVTSKETLVDIVNSDKNIDNTQRKNIEQALKIFDKYIDGIKEPSNIVYSHSVTYRLEKSIVSIEGNKDRKFIHDFVTKQMTAFDSLELRRYITKHIPSLDYTVTIKRPQEIVELLGGGADNETFQSKLSIDEMVFVNLPKYEE